MQEHKEKWTTKPLCGHFLSQTQQTADSTSWAWLTRGGLKKETKGFLMTAQDHALRTNTIKVKTDKQEGKATCRKSKNIEETVTHIISECSKLIQKIADLKSWAWLTAGGLKKETEGFLMAAQDQALQTNAIKVKIDKHEGEPMCRMCKNRK